MSDLVKSQPAFLASRQERVAGREIERIRCSADIATARHNNKIDVVESVTESALLATAHISALEGHLMSRVPEHARGRLAFVADGGAMAMATVVSKLAKS